MFKFLHHHWRRRWERYYSRNQWHLAIDLSLVLVVIVLAVGVFALHFYSPNLTPPSFLKPSPGVVLDPDNPPLDIFISVVDNKVALEDGLDFKINLHNNSSFDLKDVMVAISPIGNAVNLQRLEAEGQEEIKIEGHKLIFPLVKAAADIEIEAKAYVEKKGISGKSVNLQASLEYQVAKQTVLTRVDLDPWLLPAELDITSVAYYTSPQGDILGLGPLPPVVGLPTNYWVFWQATSTGDLEDLVVSARLPQGVEITNNYSLLSGDFSYNSDSRQVIWRVSQINTQEDHYHLNFEIQLQPKAEQAGEIVDLLINSRYRAVDSVIGREITGTIQDLNTNLTGDHFSQGQGIVLAE